MNFNMGKFDTANFKERTKRIPVKNVTLLKFFEPNGNKAPEVKPGEDGADPVDVAAPVFVLRGLDAIEMALAKQEVDNSRNRETMIDAVFGNVPAANLEAIKKLAGVVGYDSDGVPEELPADYVRRLYYLLHGCVEPKFKDQWQVMKFARAFPVEFMSYTNEILQLSGMGMELGE